MGGFDGVQPAAPAMDPQAELAGWDRRVSAVGWTARGGECVTLLDPAHRLIGGIWVKRVRSAWAFFTVSMVGRTSATACSSGPWPTPSSRTW